MVTNVYVKSNYEQLCINEAVGISWKLITTRTTFVAIMDLSGSTSQKTSACTMLLEWDTVLLKDKLGVAESIGVIRILTLSSQIAIMCMNSKTWPKTTKMLPNRQNFTDELFLQSAINKNPVK